MVPAAVVAGAVLVAEIATERFYAERHIQELRVSMTETLGTLRARVEGNINGNAQLVRGLVAAIGVEPNISQKRFAALAAQIFRARSHLRNIGAAPDLVIRFMYPLKGNEAAIGFDYRTSPTQREAAERARAVDDIVVAGPVNLVQGGQGFISRMPVFSRADGSGEQGRFWGLVSAVIDVDRFYSDSGLYDDSLPIEVAIRGRDARGAEGETFFGDERIFNLEPILANVRLPYGYWQMAAVPKGGWPSSADYVGVIRALFLFGGLLAVSAALAAARLFEQRRRAEAVARRSEARFRTFAEASSDWLWETDANHRFTYFSDGITHSTGYLPFDLVGRSRLDVLTATVEERTFWDRHFTELAERRPFRDLRYRYPRSDGSTGWVSVSGKPVFDEHGAFAGYRGSGREISRQVAMESRLRELTEKARAAEQRLRVAIESIADAFVLYDADDRLVLFNEKYREFYRKSADVMVPGMSFEEILRYGAEQGQYPEAAGRVDEWVAERVAAHRAADTVIEQQLDDGRWLRIAERRTPDGGNVGFRVDITELKKAREAAEQANQAKSVFLSSMSHELRTPLNAVIGFGQVLELDAENPLSPRQRDAVAHILKGGRHLLELIEQILDLAKIESGKIALSMAAIDPAPIIGECVTMAGNMAERRGITVENRCTGAGQEAIRADRTRFKQALLNLLSNAVKYNVDGGSVTVACERTAGGAWRFLVADTGIGIPAARHKEVFRPFSRLGAENTVVEGTGIGLSITRELVHLMGGEIGFESTEGAGSTFWIDLPAAGPAAEAEPAGVEERMPPVPAAAALPPCTVLYVEDNPANLELMEMILSLAGNVRLLSAHTAELGLVLAEREHPDVILMDINLPGINGIEALGRIRRNPAIAGIPVVAVSADAMPVEIEKAMAAGFTRYVTKPFAIQGVLGAIADVMRHPLPAIGRAAAADPAKDPAAGSILDGDAIAVLERSVEALSTRYLDILERQRDALGRFEADVRAAIDAQDAKAVEAVAHKMKTNSRTFGAQEVAALAQRIELLGKEGRLDEARAALADLAREQARIMPAVDELLGRLRASAS